MTSLLIKWFIPGFDDPQDARARTLAGRLSGITGIVCNTLLFALKLFCGILTGAVSITADAMNNLADASARWSHCSVSVWQVGPPTRTTPTVMPGTNI